MLEGEKGCLPHLVHRIKEKGHCVIVVAEGAGEELLGTSSEKGGEMDREEEGRCV